MEFFALIYALNLKKYTYVCDNNMFCIATNHIDYIQRGLVHVSTKYNEKQRAAIHSSLGNNAKREIPYIVHYYNYNMNAIDVIDQLIGSYDRHHNGSSWKIQIYNTSFQTMEVIIINLGCCIHYVQSSLPKK